MDVHITDTEVTIATLFGGAVLAWIGSELSALRSRRDAADGRAIDRDAEASQSMLEKLGAVSRRTRPGRRVTEHDLGDLRATIDDQVPLIKDATVRTRLDEVGSVLNWYGVVAPGEAG